MTVIACCTKCGVLKDASHFDRMVARRNGLRPDCKECRKPIRRAYVKANPERAAARQARWQKENPERVAAIQRRYADSHREHRQEQSKDWQKRNRAADAARSAAQRANEKRATPAWANAKYIRLFYELAKLERERTGKDVHVDHIYPLTSPMVCGLHVEDNLQLLFATDNIAKKNKMPNLNGGGLSL